MKRHFSWMMAAILLCGSVFTACSNDDDKSSSSEEKKGGADRQEFVAHTRANLKELAENLNFSSWRVANFINNDFNANVLANPEFDKTVSTLFRQEVRNSIKFVEEGSELEKMGYLMYAVVDLTEFNYSFTMNEEGTGFDVEPAEDFRLVVKPTMKPRPEGVERPDGEERPERPEGAPRGDRYECLILKASGSSNDMIAKRMSTDQLAVIVRVPNTFDFTIGALAEDGTVDADFTGTFKTVYESRVGSSFIDIHTDAWNISGTLQSSIERPKRSESAEEGEGPKGPGASGVGPKDDATTLSFAIGQDPKTHEAGLKLGFIHNGKNILKLRGVMENTNGATDYSSFTSDMSIAEAFTAIMAGNNLKEGTITMLDDLTTTIKVTDCQKVVQLQNAMARARRNYADEATIDSYTQQLNELVSSSMTCKGVSQTIPMKLQTTKFGIDYWAMPALKFSDETEYVALTDMLDQESVAYMANIVDHAVEPMQQSIITIRLLMQYLRTMVGDVREQRQSSYETVE